MVEGLSGAHGVLPNLKTFLRRSLQSASFDKDRSKTNVETEKFVDSTPTRGGDWGKEVKNVAVTEGRLSSGLLRGVPYVKGYLSQRGESGLVGSDVRNSLRVRIVERRGSLTSHPQEPFKSNDHSHLFTDGPTLLSETKTRVNVQFSRFLPFLPLSPPLFNPIGVSVLFIILGKFCKMLRNSSNMYLLFLRG